MKSATIVLAALSALAVDAESEGAPGVRGLQEVMAKSAKTGSKDAKAKSYKEDSTKAAKLFKSKHTKSAKTAGDEMGTEMSDGSDAGGDAAGKAAKMLKHTKTAKTTGDHTKSAKFMKAKHTKSAKTTGDMGMEMSEGSAGAMGGCGDITEEQIMAAQETWGEGIVKINAAYEAGEDHVAVATEHIETLYAYGMGHPILFKPTLAAEEQFRSTFEGALSYFVTGEVEEDTGFAIKGWRDVRFENDGIIATGDVGMSMGNYFFEQPDGNEAKVEYSFGYILDDACMPRIYLHHSSLPYDPNPAGGDTKSITREHIEEAQKAWGDGIVNINAAFEAGEDYEAAAEDHINTLYAYGITPVLFKPTLAAEEQFRSTFEGALSYFVKGEVEEDTGFAIKGWTGVRFENVDILTEGPVGQAMGNYFFAKADGSETKVEYSFGYILDDDGNVRINLHHSALPYAGPGITQEQIEEAQKAWGDGIVRIAAAHTAEEDFEAVATDHINTLYAYEMPPVLFKPTLAAEQQFRPTFDDALSYFVATGHVEEDSGFAIKGWTDVRFENDGGILTAGDLGLAMGNYFFTTPDGDEVKVEYSFAYKMDGEGFPRIHLHHSSTPYDPSA